MKYKILNKASEMFLNLGFKSVTMDDIASALGVSKKTIYSHFANKNKLVEESTSLIFEKVCQGINFICGKEENSIKELFEIKKFIFTNFSNENISPQHQLQKFFPEIHQKMKNKHFGMMKACIEKNLKRGIKDGLFLPNLNTDFVTRIYFTGINGIKDEHIFPEKEFRKKELMTDYLQYHIKAISTTKGIEKLEQIINNKQN
ncbi:MAG: TetR/AcrR family transcriptional regulator [Wenyingzhuangia sp.]|uniref:TetR/AcrR family transcriptional regulator n=1 Tax=Wenyingzhuangia sp. TaxID=1964193 RepID=UPI003218EB2A